MSEPNVPIGRPVLDATKAVRAALTVALVPVGLFVQAIVDGSLSWDEAGEVLTSLLAIPAAYGVVYSAENKPKRRT